MDMRNDKRHKRASEVLANHSSLPRRVEESVKILVTSGEVNRKDPTFEILPLFFDIPLNYFHSKSPPHHPAH